MEEKLIQFFNDNNIDPQDKKMVLAVSTGIDSMVMLYSFLALQKKYNFNIIVAHVNHNKREQSLIEKEFIKNFCSKEKLLCYIKDLDFSLNTENFQMAARKARYDFFLDVLKKERADYLVLAHHSNDNMETILMRIIRGSSLSGYSGMSEVSSFGEYQIIRPFLGILKKDIEKYQKENEVPYYEDSSNKESIYTRNRIRKEVIPGLLEEGDSVHLKFLEFSKTIKDASDELEKIRDQHIKEIMVVKDEYVIFMKKDFLKISLYMQTEILYEILKPYNLGKGNINELLKLINTTKSNLEVVYKKNLTFVKEYGKIYFFFKELKDDKIEVKIDEMKKYVINDTISISVTKKRGELVTNLSSLWYNSDKLPVVIRSRKPADKIKLSQGYKKVKDLLIDMKVGILKRRQILVLEDSSQEILMVFGIKKSECLKNIKESDILISLEEKNGRLY